jgi:two-component system, chemotaxis family, chemotaxis protein CheV
MVFTQKHIGLFAFYTFLKQPYQCLYQDIMSSLPFCKCQKDHRTTPINSLIASLHKHRKKTFGSKSEKEGKLAMEQGILLEAGTNELEILSFKLGSTPFGINVAKVREIIQPCKTITIPYTPDAIAGSFKIRDKILTLINLGRYFGMEGDEVRQGRGMIIIVEFNNICCGILVDEVQRIHRLRWDQIQAPSQYLMDLQVPLTGMVNIDSKTILIIDFETIVGDILGVQCVDVAVKTPVSSVSQEEARIMVVDDSSFVRSTLITRLNETGLTNLMVCNDGQHAWETLEAQCDQKDGPCDLILSDIEMPRMDGLHLTSKIKNDPQLKHIPVVLFSSLITPDNLKKCKAVGADAQVSKPNGEEMIRAIMGFLEKNGVSASPKDSGCEEVVEAKSRTSAKSSTLKPVAQ